MQKKMTPGSPARGRTVHPAPLTDASVLTFCGLVESIVYSAADATWEGCPFRTSCHPEAITQICPKGWDLLSGWPVQCLQLTGSELQYRACLPLRNSLTVVELQISIQEPNTLTSQVFPKHFLTCTHSLQTRFKIILVTGVEKQRYFLLKNKMSPSSIFLQGKYIPEQATNSLIFCIHTSSICAWILSEFSKCLRLQGKQ